MLVPVLSTRARELIAQKQRDKALKEKEHVKHKENERRTTGQQQLRVCTKCGDKILFAA